MSDKLQESDWKLYRDNVPEWQERFWEKRRDEYLKLLLGPECASEKIYKLEEIIRKDRKKVEIGFYMSRSKMFEGLCILLGNGIITVRELEIFSDDLRGRLTRLMSADD